MRIGKLARWLILIILVGGALIWLGINLVQERNLQQQLNTTITETGQQLSIFTTQHNQGMQELEKEKQELEEQLGSYSSPVQGLLARFDSPGKSIEIDEDIYEDAHNANVTIIEIKTSLPRTEEQKKEVNTEKGKIEKVTVLSYESNDIQITAEGEVVALLNFIDKLHHRFAPSAITQVRITVPEPPSEEEEEEEDVIVEETEELPTLTLNLEIYSYVSKNG